MAMNFVSDNITILGFTILETPHKFDRRALKARLLKKASGASPQAP